MFTTKEKLENGGDSGVANLYEWHCASPCKSPATEGVVSRISTGSGVTAESNAGTNGVAGNEVASTAMSASGSDVLFFTTTPLVKQDTDELGDLYDARAPVPDEPGRPAGESAGFPAPPVVPSCAEEACQGSPSAGESFGVAPSSQASAGGNLLPPAGATLAFKAATPKPLTNAQKLAKALKTCKSKPKKKRAGCESSARKKYAPKAKAKKARAKKTDRGGR